MEQLVFKTEIYEGPLDLLLDIIAKNKMSIFDIKISLIFEQYMAYLREMQEMNMEIAGGISVSTVSPSHTLYFFSAVFPLTLTAPLSMSFCA